MGISLVPISSVGSGMINSEEFETYAGAHNAAVGHIVGWSFFSVGQWVRNSIYSETGYEYQIRRLEGKYDLSSLGGLTISSTRVYFPKGLIELCADDINQGNLHVVGGCGDNPIDGASFGNLLDKTVSGGVIECPYPPPSGWDNWIEPTEFYMELNATGISWLSLGSSISPLAFRISGDKNNIPNAVLPSEVNHYKLDGAYCYLCFVKASACRPIGWLPTVTIDNITATSASLHGIHAPGTAMLRIVHDGADDEYPKYRFVYGKTRYARDNYTDWKNLSAVIPNEEVPSEPIAGLEPGTLYYVEMQVDYGGDIGTQWCPWEHRNYYVPAGGYRTFSTLTVLPTVTTNPATLITGVSATLNGTLTNDGGEACDCGFEYGRTSAYGETTPTQSRTTGQTFSQGIVDLSPGKTYHFRAKAVNSVGTAYGADMVFNTLAEYFAWII